MMANVDHLGRIFLYHLHTDNGFIFYPLLNTSFYISKNMNNDSKNPEYPEMRHADVIFTL